MEQAQALSLMHARINRWCALGVLAFVLGVFISTMAPSVSFWDPGEYVAAGHSLGIPHPPGNPLYVMITRVFSVALAFVKEVAVRINFLSPLCGAFTAFFIYLIVVRVLVGWLGVPDSPWKRVTVYLCGIVGALYAVLGNTFWFSSVEAEVLVLSMLFVVVGTWLALVWAQSKDPKRDRLLVLNVYLVFLGVGVHMMSMLAIAPVALFVLLTDKDKAREWRLWVAGILLFSVMYSMSMFLYAAPLLVVLAAVYAFMEYKDSRTVNVVVFALAVVVRVMFDVRELNQHQIEAVDVFQNSLPFALLLVLSIVELLQDNTAQARRFRDTYVFVFWLSCAAVLGYSVHLYVPIRSTLCPIVDENHPATWEPFKEFLERKQYGSDNMVLRMLHRRGSWQHQLGTDSNMGFGGFHLTQFFHFGPSATVDRTTSLFTTWGSGGGFWRLLVYLLPTGFMFFGWYYLYHRARNVTILLATLVLMGTFALVFYMNFADGTRMEKYDQDYWQATMDRAMGQGLSRTEAESRIPKPDPVHREVRVRDYFFTSGFLFFGAWMGISAACLLHLLFGSRRRYLRTVVAPIAVVLFAVSPALPIASNYNEATRAGDFTPFDYAYNLLMSCDRDGVLFTNGDNDTFPLWALQEGYGVRKDVRIVNLSLLNTKWYIKQLKDVEPKLALGFSDAEIDNMPHERNPFAKDTPIRLQKAGISVVVPGQQSHPVLKVQDKLVLNIVDANRWRKPVYFAVTVSDDNRMGLDPYLSMEGMVYRVNPTVVPAQKRVDIDRTLYMLDMVYRYRGLGTAGINLNETSYRLLANYSAGYMYVSYALREPMAQMKAEVDSLSKAAAGPKAAPALKSHLDSVRAAYERTVDLVVRKMDECVSLMPWDFRPRTMRHEVLLRNGRAAEALARAREALGVNPDWVDYKKMMVQAYEELGQRDSATALLRELTEVDPDPWYTYVSLAQNYAERGRYDSAISWMEQYQESHAGDRRPAALIEHFRRQMAGGSAPSAEAGAPVLKVK